RPPPPPKPPSPSSRSTADGAQRAARVPVLQGGIAPRRGRLHDRRAAQPHRPCRALLAVMYDWHSSHIQRNAAMSTALPIAKDTAAKPAVTLELLSNLVNRH